jgi:hypothetical protein
VLVCVNESLQDRVAQHIDFADLDDDVSGVDAAAPDLLEQIARAGGAVQYCRIDVQKQQLVGEIPVHGAEFLQNRCAAHPVHFERQMRGSGLREKVEGHYVFARERVGAAYESLGADDRFPADRYDLLKAGRQLFI